MVGRGAFRFGRSSPPRFPAHTEGVGSRLRCLAESRETTAEGPPGSDGRRWTAAVATREGWDGICPKISTSALDWREGGAGRVSHRSLLRCCRRTCCGGRPARGPSPRDEPGSRARCVRTSCLGAVCDGTRSPGRWLPVPNPAANHDSGPAPRTGELLAKRFAANRGFWLRARRRLVGRSTFVTHHRTALDRHVRVVHPRRELDPGVRGEAHRAQVRRGEQEEGEEGLVRTIDGRRVGFRIRRSARETRARDRMPRAPFTLPRSLPRLSPRAPR